ncbi:hypothetical protein LOK49_LG09G00424 [Camellia lanceoleosa]|uniref:Uncharacterized protein n=1 Tax=Camellia lanceoleosa TaxID=1840588 RepID=A0ACC0GFN6_9ERIC|nr:hypothetical protein LOK49_LG09G00424 [Camellia lanceoleosa]
MEILNMNHIHILLLIISIFSLVTFNFNGATAANPHPQTKPARPSTLNPAIKKICDSTDYSAVCASSVVPYLINGKTDRASVLIMQVNAGIHATERGIQITKRAMNQPSTSYVAQRVNLCLQEYDSALDDWKGALGFVKARREFEVANVLTTIVSHTSVCEDSFAEDPTFNMSTFPFVKINDLIRTMAGSALSIRINAFPEK